MALICPGERRVHRSSDRGCYLSSAHSGLYTVVKIESGLWWSSFVGGWSERNPQKVILRRGSSHYFSSFLLCQLRLCTLPRSVCVCLTSAKGNRILPPHTHTHKVRSQISFYLQLEHYKSEGLSESGVFLCVCVGEGCFETTARAPLHLMAAVHHHATCIQCVQRLQESRGGWRRRLCVQLWTQGDTNETARYFHHVSLLRSLPSALI